MKKILSICLAVFCCFQAQTAAQIPTNVLVQISKAEDELRFDKTLEDLLKSPNALIRARAALAAGRTGREAAVAALTNLLETDLDTKTRASAAFALGEIESKKGADALLRVLKTPENAPEIRARALEAAGKIAAATSPNEKKIAEDLGAAILIVLDDENVKPNPNREIVLHGITAILRAKPNSGEFIAAKFLTSADARIRADAANTLSRLRAKNANVVLREMLFKDKDAIARANAARALGAAEDKEAFDLLLGTALNDADSRVRVSAIRSLGSLKKPEAADRLLTRADILFTDYKNSKFDNPAEKSELLEIAAVLGRLLPNSNNKKAEDFLLKLREQEKSQSPEIEIAYARISPSSYSSVAIYRTFELKLLLESASVFSWKSLSSVAQGFGELANLEAAKEVAFKKDAEQQLRHIIETVDGERFETFKKIRGPGKLGKEVALSSQAIPDVLGAYAGFKTTDLPQILQKHLKHKDIIVRAAAAGILGEQPANKESIEALKIAFGESLETDKQYNDAQLAILSALVKLDKKEAIGSLNSALDAPNFLLRRHAAQLVKQNDLQTSFPNAVERVGTVKPYNRKTGTKLGQVLNAEADYARAVSRRTASAILTTEKGNFTIEFFPEVAPLTVDNFIKLANAKYFDGLTIHRVVPNFVMQDGDPRGDGNGSPGWEIRDEINTTPFERGTVGMALSGKDTGGSQWFVCHAPQPHLDGGYTVFGRVSETDMKVVDNLVRGDKILSVRIIESGLPQRTQSSRRKK